MLLQARNYVSRREQERKRRELFDDALSKFNKSDVEVSPKSLQPCSPAVAVCVYVMLRMVATRWGDCGGGGPCLGAAEGGCQWEQ